MEVYQFLLRTWWKVIRYYLVYKSAHFEVKVYEGDWPLELKNSNMTKLGGD